MKYLSEDVMIGFQEVPDEISLLIPITGCPNRCLGCHSPELREDIGEDFTWDNINALIEKNKGISCVCFLGGDQNPREIDAIASYVKHKHNLKTCWYSGCNAMPENILSFDYFKIGPYDRTKGGLDSPSTNQRFYQVKPAWTEDGWYSPEIKDITYKFYKQ